MRHRNHEDFYCLFLFERRNSQAYIAGCKFAQVSLFLYLCKYLPPVTVAVLIG